MLDETDQEGWVTSAPESESRREVEIMQIMELMLELNLHLSLTNLVI